MQGKLLAKVEELTLHMIEEEERSQKLLSENRELYERIARLESRAATAGAAPGRAATEEPPGLGKPQSQ
jgi:hypothetical protein